MLSSLYGSNPIVFGAVNNFRRSLFSYKREKHFEIVCTSSELRRFFNDILLGRGGFEGLYGQAYDLEGFMRGVLQSLLIFGKAFYKIDWAEQDHAKNKTRWVVERIRWLAIETMYVVTDDGRIQGFKQEYSDHCSYEDLRGIKIEFGPDEIFFVEWVFDEERNRGVSPLKRLIPLSKGMDEFLEYINLRIKVLHHPEDRSYAVERARFTPWEKAKKKNDQCKIKIQDALGIMPDAPMTEYYDIHQFIKSRRRIAQIREYLVAEFNDQIVNRISKKNGFAESPRIKLVGYKSVSEIDELFGHFKRKEVSNKEVVDAFRDELI